MKQRRSVTCRSRCCFAVDDCRVSADADQRQHPLCGLGCAFVLPVTAVAGQVVQDIRLVAYTDEGLRSIYLLNHYDSGVPGTD